MLYNPPTLLSHQFPKQHKFHIRKPYVLLLSYWIKAKLPLLKKTIKGEEITNYMFDILNLEIFHLKSF